MSILDQAKQIVSGLLMLGDFMDGQRQARLMENANQRDYYLGFHERQMKVKERQPDDNLTLNFTGLVVERSVSMLFGDGIEFDMPGEPEDENQQYIDELWAANKKDILLHKLGQFGGIHGTCYLKIIPDGAESRTEENKYYPRIVPLDPMFMEIETDPEDIDAVIRYVMRFKIKDENDQETARKEVTERVYSLLQEEDAGQIVESTTGWVIRNYKSNAMTGGKWELINEEYWDYEFPPILHWQNLPLAGDIYGKPDITPDVIEVQDRINFIASNISRIIRYHAHPKTWGRDLGGKSDKQSWGADQMVVFSGESAHIENLEMQSDLQSSQQYLMNLRQSLFDISRTVDITSLSDKLGALTNFGLRVLFLDSVAKLNSKQELYGEALIELNHRLLVLGEIGETDGGEIVWPDVLPSNETEEMQADGFDLEKGLASKHTIAVKRGYDWEEEQERMSEEAAAGDNVGAAILRAFETGA